LNQFYKNMMTLAICLIIVLSIFSFWGNAPQEKRPIDYSRVLNMVAEGDVR